MRILPGFAQRPPLARLPAHPAIASWTHAISRVDTSGRVADRSVLATLEWAARDRVTVTAEGNNVIIFSRDDRAHETVLDGRRIRVPVAPRRPSAPASRSRNERVVCPPEHRYGN
ncbi:hypothetical protein [Amycolatopsis sp. NPDC098790]|uniref:hypothetical protein n=1 Tax=Amycolatopsis sp. NPDC098790 TaxID=3363939 RepID=UPI0038051746